MNRRTFGFEIFLVALAAIILEVSYTRVFSFKLFYYFTYLTIGIALLGIGSGGVFVSISKRLRDADAGFVVAVSCALTAIAVPLGYVAISVTQLNALEIVKSAAEAAKLVVICGLLFAPFLLVGVVIATIFSDRPQDITRLYFADLVGAGMGCAAAIPLFETISPPGAIMLSGALFGVAGLRLARQHSALLFGVTLIAVLAVLPFAFSARLLPDPVPDAAKSMSPQRRGTTMGGSGEIVFSRWSSVFRVDVETGPPTQHIINHDGNIGSTILQFDGDLSKMTKFDHDLRSIPFSVLKPNPKVLIIGAAGGHEILASLYFGASHITGVELNPTTVSLLTTHLADYSGRLPENERVTLVNEEGRSFMKRTGEKFDLIWFVAPDTYAAMNAASSGGFVLSESYLYTREAIVDSMTHLAEGGVVCLQTGDIDFKRKPNRAVRYLTTARSALEKLGIADFPKHVLVSSTPEFFTNVTTLLSNEPFTDDQIHRFQENAVGVKPIGTPSTVLHPPSAPQSDGGPQAVQRVISVPEAELETWYDAYPYNVTPVTDDAPFFWHFSSFRRALFHQLDVADYIFDPEDAKGERVLVALLIFAVVFSALLLFTPFLVVRSDWRRIPYKGRAAVYFAALGLGFMFFEIALIQKFTLFVGYPTYSLTITLFSLLIFSGIGSLLSGTYLANRDRALVTLVAFLVVLTCAYQYGTPWVVENWIGQPLAMRGLICGLLLAPLGLCLGAFMPIGLRTVASVTDLADEYVAWSWAVNGFFSVMSSVLATILSMTFGFTAVLWMAVGIYVIGVTALRGIPFMRAEG